MARPKRNKPYNPAAPIHDRQSKDLLRNAMVAVIDVDDPMGLEPGDKIRVLRSIRDDPLARMHARHQIDEAQYEAGKQYRSDWERAERGPRAIDPSKEYVDGGLMPEPITEAQRRAVATLSKLSRVLGMQTEHVLRRVLCGNLFPGQVAAELDMTAARDADHMAWLFRQGLEVLAKEYGFVMDGDKR